jgi:ParB/RepB/Spo0J family partition protein
MALLALCLGTGRHADQGHHTMKLPLSSLEVSSHNVRRADSNVTDLAQSLNSIGLINPLTVRPHANAPDRYMVVAGSRRMRAAALLGWGEIDCTILAETDADSLAVSAAENFARAGMEPVDQWRAIADLCEQTGMNTETAAATLGIPFALARRLGHLGRMAPEVLNAISGGDLPSAPVLRAIAAVDHETQRAALGRGNTQAGVDWLAVRDACTVRTVNQADAIFDPAAAPEIHWTEDMFAEPGDPRRFTSSNIDAFLACQRSALEKQAAASKGRIEVVEPGTNSYTTSALPRGWRATWDEPPKRWRKDDPRRVFACVSPDGRILRTVATPAPEPLARATAGGSVASTGPADRPRIQKATLARLADLKVEGLRERLRVFADNGPADMLRLVVALFGCSNVSTGTAIEAPIRDVLPTEDGTLDDARVCQIAADLIADVVRYPKPDEWKNSGRMGEAIAVAVGAQVPRCDTADILRGFSHEALIEIATEHAIPTHGNASALRKRMVGALPDWRPVEYSVPVQRSAFIDERDPEGDAQAQAEDVEADDEVLA